LMQEEYLSKSNYESFYEDISANDKHNDDVKSKLNKIIFDIFCKEVDYYCRHPNWDTLGPSPQDKLQKFFIKFFNTGDKSIFFTLNQDLFIERQLHFLTSLSNDKQSGHIATNVQNIKKQKYIYLKRLGVDDARIPTSREYKSEFGLVINNQNAQQASEEISSWEEGQSYRCPYVKLHGSQDYKDEDGNPIMITGLNKKDRVSKYDLIHYYSEKFNEILTKKSCKIIIIGYGFNDNHINKVIVNSLCQGDNHFYIIDKKSLNCFLNGLSEKPEFSCDIVKTLKCKLRGYLSCGLNSIDLNNNVINNFLPKY